MAKLPTCSACSTLEDPKPAADVTIRRWRRAFSQACCLPLGPGNAMADCAACSALSWGAHHRCSLRVREPSRVTATCGGWGSVPGELGRCPNRYRPMLSAAIRSFVARMWPGVTSLEGYPPPMAFHRWASDGSAGLSRHVRASILRPTAAKAPRISRRMMIQVTGGFLPPPRPASLEQPAPRYQARS